MNNIHTFIICTLLIVLCRSNTHAQATFAETLVCGDTTIYIHSNALELSECKPDREYFWVKNGKIAATRAGYGGRVLDGEYKKFVGKQMVEKGFFSKGLKHGTWTVWEANQLQSTTQWKKGLLHGATVLFDTDGTITKKEKFRRGKAIKNRPWVGSRKK